MTQQRKVLKGDTLLTIGGIGLIGGAILLVISTIWPASVDLSGTLMLQKEFREQAVLLQPAHCS